MEQASRPNGPGSKARLNVAVIGGIAIFVVTAWAITHRGNGSDARTSYSATASAVAEAPPSPGGLGTALSVFASPREPSDVLPAATLDVSSTLSVGGTPAKPDLPRFGQSHLVATVGGVGFYVWPISKRGLCSGLGGDGTETGRCMDVGPGAGEVYATLVGTSGDRRYVGAVIGKGVTAITVNAPGLTCSVRVERSGFICIGPAADPRPVTAQLHLRSGATTSAIVG